MSSATFSTFSELSVQALDPTWVGLMPPWAAAAFVPVFVPPRNVPGRCGSTLRSFLAGSIRKLLPIEGKDPDERRFPCCFGLGSRDSELLLHAPSVLALLNKTTPEGNSSPFETIWYHTTYFLPLRPRLLFADP